MRERLVDLAEAVRQAVLPELRRPQRQLSRESAGGDPHFVIDELAERAVFEVLRSWHTPVAYFSEDRGLVEIGSCPELLLVIDPIDGTRPAAACFESACFSVAVAPFSTAPRFQDVQWALVAELATGYHFYATTTSSEVVTSRPGGVGPSAHTDLGSMFWSIELTAHPVRRLIDVYGHLVDDSVLRGAVFVFTSTSYSLTRIATGQLDCHVDVGHRILRDRPVLREEFLRVGHGKCVTLFPYDVAGAAFIALRAGATVTDAYGRPLDNLLLITDKTDAQQCSLVAAGNAALHEKVLSSLNWSVSS